MSIEKNKLIEIYSSLAKIRKTELKIEDLYHLDEMKTPVHLSLGQEAISVGVCTNLRKDDLIFSNHRSHGHYLAKGGDLNAMIAELHCKETGCSKGRGGSMHLIDTSVGHLGSSSIVAGSIPHAVGAALAFQMKKKDNVAVSFFGDACCEEGILYESMNFAVLKQLPVVFVCENNRYAVCSHLKSRQVDYDLHRRAEGFNMRSEQIDGMDIFAVYESAKNAIDYARSGKGPAFIEYTVERWRAHAGAGDSQKEKYRDDDELKNPDERDPVKILVQYLIDKKIASLEEIQKIDQVLDEEVEAAFIFAKESPLPNLDELTKYLFVK